MFNVNDIASVRAHGPFLVAHRGGVIAAGVEGFQIDSVFEPFFPSHD